jgi:RNA polymerase sigma-70 factor (ECF subfamily)
VTAISAELTFPSPFVGPLPGLLEAVQALSVALGRPRRDVTSAPSRFSQRATGPAIVRRVALQRLDPAEERGLCDRAKAGDRPALGKLLRTYGPVLYRAVLLPRLGSEAVAQDALAETYARVVERFDQYEWQDCGVYPWLRVVALRIALDILRARKRETLFEPDDLAREIERADASSQTSLDVEVLEARDLETARNKVEQALKTLNPRYEKAVRLRVLEERSREEVAKELGVTVSTFDVVLHRALTALKKAIHKGSEQGSAERAPTDPGSAHEETAP